MNEFLETIELKLDEENEFTFNVAVSGGSPHDSQVRFICESGDNLSYMFVGEHVDGNEFRVRMPSMKGLMTENYNYLGRLEVILEGRIFSPLHVNVHFQESMKVVAESVAVHGYSRSRVHAIPTAKVAGHVSETVRSTSPPKNLSEIKPAPVQAQVKPIVKQPTVSTSTHQLAEKKQVRKVEDMSERELRDLVKKMNSGR